MDITTIKLGKLLSHSDETVRRNAMSILKTMQKNAHDPRTCENSVPCQDCGMLDRKQGIECPLCYADVPYEERNGVHVWSCEECPFYAIEYWTGGEFAKLREWEDDEAFHNRVQNFGEQHPSFHTPEHMKWLKGKQKRG